MTPLLETGYVALFNSNLAWYFSVQTLADVYRSLLDSLLIAGFLLFQARSLLVYVGNLPAGGERAISQTVDVAS
jgi:hypothetical protein